jgi:glucosamine-phosphate N-acetyltransferase
MGNSSVPDVDIFYNRVMAKDDNYVTYVYTIEEDIVATSAILYEYKLRYIQPKAYIEDVAVHPDCRGNGYGRSIVNYCYEEAKRRNAYKVVLSCSDDLMSYYRSLGFEKENNFMIKY